MSEFLHEREDQEEFRTMSAEQVQRAVELADAVLQDNPDGWASWPRENGMNGLSRQTVSTGSEALLGSKFTATEEGRISVMRYLLDLKEGIFLVIPGIYGSLEDIDTDNDPETNPDIIDMTFSLGHHLATDGDWDDFLYMMQEGREILDARLSL